MTTGRLRIVADDVRVLTAWGQAVTTGLRIVADDVRVLTAWGQAVTTGGCAL